MNPLRDVNSVDVDMAAGSPNSAKKDSHGPHKPKTPLRKEELEKIARELKKKLSKASVTAKQSLNTSSSNLQALQAESPAGRSVLPKSSPLKNYYMWKRQIASGTAKSLNSSPSLYSPDRDSPTSTKPSVFLSSSPLKNVSENGPNGSRKSSVDSEAATELDDSPTKKRRGAQNGSEPQMVLRPISTPQTPPKHDALHPSPVLSSNPQSDRKNGKSQTTPTLQKRQLSTSNHNLMKTPTQPSRGEAYNDEVGADLLMYLATSPSPAKASFGNTPKATSNAHAAFANGMASASMSKSSSSSNQFIVPAPPLTPKRKLHTTAKTPQNRLTPSVYGNLAVPGSALPSAGLALTPAGFNMNDYVNFFTPSPGTAAAHGGAHARTLLKTPDFNGQMQNSRTSVDGKMINFDKVELFGSSGAEQHKDETGT